MTSSEQCVHCGKEISGYPCAFCGGTSGARRKKAARECHQCGAGLGSKTKICPKCGAETPTIGDALEGCGKSMQSIGCLITLFVTIPIILLAFGMCG